MELKTLVRIQLLVPLTDSSMICEKCNRKYKYEPTKGHTKTLCNSCISTSKKRAIKEYLVDNMGGKCERCGYSDCMDALHFHHVDPSTKLFEISSGLTMNFKLLQEEVDKCALLCSNCHIEVHCFREEEYLK